MFENVGYAHPLRAIGQALELLNLESFDMEPEGDDFLVRGQVVRPGMEAAEQAAQENRVRHVWGLIAGGKARPPEITTPRATTVSQIDLRYTAKDLDRLEQAGRAKRRDPNGMADAASLSQFLRTIGAYLDQKNVRLLHISRHGKSITVQYETTSGQKNEEVLGPPDLYDFWVRMYMKRAARSGS